MHGQHRPAATAAAATRDRRPARDVGHLVQTRFPDLNRGRRLTR